MKRYDEHYDPRGLLLGIAAVIFMLLFSVSWAMADGLPRQQQRIGAPYQPPAVAATSEWQLGLIGGYGWGDGGDNFVGGAFASYQVNWDMWMAGIEGDITNNPSTQRGRFHLDDWLATVRGKAGVTVVKGVQLYATAGLAIEDGDQGLAWGGGLQYELGKDWLARAEVLKYEIDGGQAVARLGISKRFSWN